MSYKIDYRFRETMYHITIRNGGGAALQRLVVDGVDQADFTIPLVDDHQDHHADVYVG